MKSYSFLMFPRIFPFFPSVLSGQHHHHYHHHNNNINDNMSTTIPANDDGALKPTGHDEKRQQEQLPFVYLEPFLDWNTFRDNEEDGNKKKSFESASTVDSFLVDAGGYHARSGFVSSSSSTTNEPSLFFRSVTTRGYFSPKDLLAKKGEKTKGVFVGEYNPIFQMSEECNKKSILGRFECGRTSATVSAKDNGLFCDQELFEAVVARCCRDSRLATSANGEDGESVRERKMIATEPLGNPVRLKSDACEIVLEKIGFKELQLVSECESVGALEKIGSGAVINLGHSNCSIVPFLNGKAQMQGATRVDVGGEKLIDCFGKMALDSQRAESVHKANFLNQMFVETGKIGSGRASMALQGQLFREMAFVSTNYDEETKAWRDCLNGKEYAKTKILQFTPQYGIKELDLNDVVAKAKHNFDKKIAMVKRFAQGDTVRNSTEKYAREFAAIEKDPRAFYEGLLNALETAEKNLKDARYARSLEVRGVTEEEANEERERGGGGRKGVRKQTTAARKRAKLMAMHAGNKETLDEVEAEEKQNATDKGFGDGEDDWSMYSQMARGADKAIDGEIKDPGAQKVSACESLWEKARAEVLAVDPQYEIRKLSGMEARQLKVRAERIRAPESLFHPEILASKGIVRQVKDTRGGLAAIVDEFIIPQGGVQDALKEAFKRCGKDVEHEILREKGKDASIVLTGGLSRLPGLQTRLQDYVISNSYPGMAPTVTLSKNGSKDGIFDAWKGLSSLSSSSSSSSAGIVVTRDEWLEHGESVFHSER